MRLKLPKMLLRLYKRLKHLLPKVKVRLLRQSLTLILQAPLIHQMIKRRKPSLPPKRRHPLTLSQKVRAVLSQNPHLHLHPHHLNQKRKKKKLISLRSLARSLLLLKEDLSG